MDPVTLKENFTTQIKTLDEQIKKLEDEREKAKEYKLKLLGGLETLELLSQEASITDAFIPEEVVMEESPPTRSTTGRSTTKK